MELKKTLGGAISSLKSALPSKGYDEYQIEYNSKLAHLKAKKQRKVGYSAYYGYDSRGWKRGHCTSYVAERYNLSHADGWRGNGGQWLATAEKLGKKTKNTPEAGDIVVTNESGYGHVAIVKAVKPDGSIVIDEMNYKGVGVVSERELPADSSRIKGYIDAQEL